MSSQSFADLGVSQAVSAALAKRGITEPFAIQNLIIGDVLAGRDVLAKSPTGSGKTLAFGVPMLDRLDANGYGRPSALVLAPTRELASQIVETWRSIAHARAATRTYPYRIPPEAISIHPNTQGRCLPKYWYFSRRVGGDGRYSLPRSACDMVLPLRMSGRPRALPDSEGQPHIQLDIWLIENFSAITGCLG